MVYGYIRVSTDLQTVENQKFEIDNYAKKKNIKIDNYIEETASGAKNYSKRRLGYLLRRLKKGDTLLASELSRLGRNLYMIMDILNYCIKKGAKVVTIKDNFSLKDDIESKVLAFAFGLSAEIERKLISQRTKEALSRIRLEGKRLGRPIGTTRENKKLYPNKVEIFKALSSGVTQRKLAKKYKIHINTIYVFVKKYKDEMKFDKSKVKKIYKKRRKKAICR